MQRKLAREISRVQNYSDMIRKYTGTSNSALFFPTTSGDYINPQAVDNYCALD